MQTHVYANGMEIACKAAASDGVSPQAFPDPCWSPPGPAAGPIVIPYPNTCYANSISNGTRTVFICGQEAAIEDQSFFSTSTGNEPATQAFKKGVKTGVIKGKAYFTQWSFDVVFEGFGVPRHQDLVGHNHGSMPSNTAVFPYIARSFTGSACKQEEKRIERACKPESEDSEARKNLRKKSPLLNALKAAKVPKTAKKGKPDQSHWTDDHCDGLGVSIGNNLKNAKDYVDEMKDIYSNLPGELQVMQALKNELQEMVTKAGAKAFAKWGARAALKQGAGSVVPGWGNAAMAVVSGVDAVLTVGDISEIRRVAIESLEKLDILQKKKDKTCMTYQKNSKTSIQKILGQKP